MTKADIIRFRITMFAPPAGVDYGIQYGSGSDYTTLDKQRSVGKSLVFHFEINVGETIEEFPRFLGPVVQGPKDSRFVYIGIGTFAGQKPPAWERRLKIPLSGISKQMVKKVLAESNLIFETTVPGVAKDGGPNCGTVKPFEGWKIVKSEE